MYRRNIVSTKISDCGFSPTKFCEKISTNQISEIFEDIKETSKRLFTSYLIVPPGFFKRIYLL